VKAALLRGGFALDAWNEWRARVDLARLDAGSQGLLPLLWDNLRRQGVKQDDRGISLQKYLLISNPRTINTL
jgi:hypothetical protein